MRRTARYPFVFANFPISIGVTIPIPIPIASAPQQILRETAFLLFIEACIERPGCVGEFLLVVGSLNPGIGIFVDLCENIDRTAWLLAVVSAGDPAISLLLAHVPHRTLEPRPVLLLLRRQAQIHLHPGRLCVSLIDHLVSGQLAPIQLLCDSVTQPVRSDEAAIDSVQIRNEASKACSAWLA